MNDAICVDLFKTTCDLGENFAGTLFGQPIDSKVAQIVKKIATRS